MALDLGSFSILYGANGAGKSNFVDALRFLAAIGNGRSIRDAIEGHYATSFGASAELAGIRGGAETITRVGNPSPIFKIDASIETKNARLTYHIAVDASTHKVTEEFLKSTQHPGSYVYHTNPSTDPIRQNPDSPGIIARYYTKTGRRPSRTYSAYEPIATQFIGRKAETVYNERWATALLSELRAIQPLELRPEVLRQYAPLGRFDIGEHGENLAATVWMLTNEADKQPTDEMSEEQISQIKSASERLGAVRDWLSELMPRAVEEVQVQMAPTGEVILALKEQGFVEPFTARSLSDGTLRLAAFALVLLGRRGRGTYVIEEIENGISTTRLGLLLSLISAATSEPYRNQVIATTHSPTILDVASKGILDDVLFLGWDVEQNASVVRSLSELAPAELRSETRLSELLTEGYLALAADR